MKKNLPAIAAILACILCIICLFEISAAKSEISYLKNDLGRYTSDVQSSIQSITTDVNRQLREQASLLAFSNWEYGEADFDAYTVELICTAVPKEYIDGETVATVFINGQRLPMTLENGEYKLTQPVSIFDEVTVSKVQFTESGTVRTENLDWVFSPRYEFLPDFYASFNGSRGSSQKSSESDGYGFSLNGTVTIDYVRKTKSSKIEAIKLLEFVDGKEIGSEQVHVSEVNAVRASETSIYGYEADGSPTAFEYILNKEYNLPYGSSFELYAEVLDSTGLSYRILVHSFSVSANGTPEEDDFGMYPPECSIYDEQGNILFEPNSELYY